MKTSDTSAPAAAAASADENTARRMGYFFFAFGMFILTLSFLTSCNTTRGFGRDVQHVGHSIERQATKVQSGR